MCRNHPNATLEMKCPTPRAALYSIASASSTDANDADIQLQPMSNAVILQRFWKLSVIN